MGEHLRFSPMSPLSDTSHAPRESDGSVRRPEPLAQQGVGDRSHRHRRPEVWPGGASGKAGGRAYSGALRGNVARMPDPVSWLAIENGWHVFASGGEEIGSVHEVTGDETADIFDGLAVRFGRSGPTRYVPAEQVGEILPDHVTLLLTVAEAEALDHFEKPAPEITITAEKAPGGPASAAGSGASPIPSRRRGGRGRPGSSARGSSGRARATSSRGSRSRAARGRRR